MFKYFLIFLLIGFSGINYFTENPNLQLAFILFLFFLILIRKINAINLQQIFFLILGFFSVYLIQMILFYKFDLYFLIKYPVFSFGIPILILMLLPADFHKLLVKLIYVWTILTLIIWLGTVLNASFDDYVSSLPDLLKLDPYEAKRKSIIIYTYENHTYLDIYRYSGFWHEPGAFAVLMFYSWYFSVLLTSRFINKYSVVFLIAILATMSTTAYLALGAVFFLYSFLILKTNFILKFVSIIALSIGFLLVYNETEFMADKISQQKQEADAVSIQGTATSGRFIGLYKSLNVIKTYPLFGRGLMSQSEADITSSEHTGYGWPGFIAKTGLILGLVYLYLLYNGLFRYSMLYSVNTKYAIVFFVGLLIVLFSQKHTNVPLFMALAIFPFLKIRLKQEKQLHYA